MRFFDVFNGDADGICALLQLRLSEPRDATLVTGVKRDIKLLDRVPAQAGDQLTVLDISMLKNQAGLVRALDAGASVLYIDHHQSGDIPVHPNLQVVIDTASNVCTALLADRWLAQQSDKQQYSAWAVTGAFGDNLIDAATTAAKSLHLSSAQLEALNELGTSINYNGYGATITDLHFDPADLYRHLLHYSSPFDFIADSNSHYSALTANYHQDMAQVESLLPEYKSDRVAVYVLPDEKWANRVSGVFGNQLANQFPNRAHAVLSHDRDGGFVVSVRAPLNNKIGADELCSQFPTGGGRKGAAGINHLPIGEYDRFVSAFEAMYRQAG